MWAVALFILIINIVIGSISSCILSHWQITKIVITVIISDEVFTIAPFHLRFFLLLIINFVLKKSSSSSILPLILRKILDRPAGNSALLLPHVPDHPGRRRGDPAWLLEEDHAGHQSVIASHWWWLHFIVTIHVIMGNFILQCFVNGCSRKS